MEKSKLMKSLIGIGTLGILSAGTIISVSSCENASISTNIINWNAGVKDNKLSALKQYHFDTQDGTPLGESPTFIMDLQPNSVIFDLPELSHGGQAYIDGGTTHVQYSYSVIVDATKLMMSFSVLDDTLLNSFISTHGTTIGGNVYVSIGSILKTEGLIKNFKAALLNGDHQFADCYINEHVTYSGY
jgi:hypothetical protein